MPECDNVIVCLTSQVLILVQAKEGMIIQIIVGFYQRGYSVLSDDVR